MKFPLRRFSDFILFVLDIASKNNNIQLLIQLEVQHVLKFIQNTVNPMGYEVDELGKFGDEGDFDDGYEQNIEYVIDSEDYRLF